MTSFNAKEAHNEVYLGTLEKEDSLSNKDILLKGSIIADIDAKSACAKVSNVAKLSIGVFML